jgi:hypothetical protein
MKKGVNGRNKMIKTLDELKVYIRNNSTLNEKGCWDWLGGKNAAGYGRLTFRKMRFLAHRASFFAFNGKISKSKNACHRCDNPACVNPDHIFKGTQLDNIRDCIKKGRFRARGVQGERNGLAKLNNETVISLRSDKRTSTELAKIYGVSLSSICRARKKETWRNI